MKRLFIFIVALSFVALPVIAGSTYDKPVSVWESETDIAVQVTPFAMADSTGNYYSKAIYIGDCNTINAFCTAWTNAQTNDDVNLHLEYSVDRETWKDMTVGSGKLFDDLNGGTLQSDTINVVAGVADALYHTALYVRVHLDGQTSNPSTTEVTVLLHFTKHKALPVKQQSKRVRNRVS